VIGARNTDPRVARAAARGGRGRRSGASQPSAAPVLRGPQRDRHEPDYLILFSIVALAAVGILMVYSSVSIGTLVDDPFAVIGPQAFWAVAGVLAMLVMMRIDYRYLRLVSVPAFLGAVALLIIVLLPAMGPFDPHVINGSARWLQIGPLPALHPAEVTKMALVIYLAHWLTRKGTKAGSLLHGLVPFLVITGPVLLLVLLEPDLGTTGVLALTALVMFFAAGGSLLQLAAVIPVGLAAVAYRVSTTDYQAERVAVFLNPWADPVAGYQTTRALMAMGQGGTFGIGLGQGHQPGGLYLPQAQNDFVFALLAQELGFIGGIVVIGLYLLFAYRGLRVAMAAPDTFGALLATGITGWLTLQAFINIAVVVVLIPITGITLPFVSAGGSSLVVSFAAVGILLSVSRETLPRGSWKDADSDRRRRNWRPRLSRAGRGTVAARAGA
jgi:cell division protein FtsW